MAFAVPIFSEGFGPLINQLFIFLPGKMLVMKGTLYIFVKPNQESILALSMKKTEKLNQQLIFHKTQLPNTTTILKNVIPYYS